MKKSGKNKKASKKPKTQAKFKPRNKVNNKSGVMPLGDRVLVRPLSPEELGTATSFGIIIPETVNKEKSEQGIVVAVGAGKKTDDGKLLPVSVKPGDKIMFNKYGFDEVEIGGVEYYIVGEQNILAVLQ